MKLRPATADDDRLIKHMVREARINPFQLDWRHFWVVVDDGGRVAGCCQVKTHSDGSRELASLVVVREQRGRGLARLLIEKLKAEHGAPLYLTCRSELIPLYQRFGFSSVAPADMPPYFRRISRLAGWFMRFARPNNTLAVMLWVGGIS
jgi:N-acetylglutamate synthase-like GNAT family acetyltransferase